jgi:xylulokinase
MGNHILAFDLGTGGNKAVLYDSQGNCLAKSFVAYPTYYPASGWHEQNPMDWWRAVVDSTRRLFAESRIDPNTIACCGISGHSLGVVPLDRQGKLLRERTPIWTDSRPAAQALEFFQHVSEEQWYYSTGNGFPPRLYSVFKIMWYRDAEPDMFNRIHKVIGTKDFVNCMLTGRMVTDHSYASGSGVYDLVQAAYADKLIAASRLPSEIFPQIVPSTEVIGELTAEASRQLGLPKTVKVVAGGVDNACMALGGKAFKEGRIYNALGTSSWVAVSSAKPVLDIRSKPYVFAHILPNMFASAMGVFSTGSAFNWVRDNFCQDLIQRAQAGDKNAYDAMFDLAAQSRPGANRLLFIPSMAGGSSLDPSPNIRGSYIGIDLGHTRADLIRAAMEGIAFALRVVIDELAKLTRLSDEIVAVGGGNQNSLWRQIYADIYNRDVVKTSVGQEVSALGAAATAAVGTGLWRDFEVIDAIHQVEEVSRPTPAARSVYEQLFPIYLQARQFHADIGDRIAGLTI